MIGYRWNGICDPKIPGIKRQKGGCLFYEDVKENQAQGKSHWHEK